VPIGDIHLGAEGCDENKLDKLLHWVLSKEDCYVIGMGDYAECIAISDKRFCGKSVKREYSGELSSLINDQRNTVIRKFKPLADEGRLLGMITGNHEFTTTKYSFDIMKDICSSLGVPNLGYSFFYRLTLMKKKSPHKNNVIIYGHHGWGGGRKPGASMNKMVDAVSNYDADIYLMAHDHQKYGKRLVRLGITDQKGVGIRERPCILARTGTFLRTCQEGDFNYSERFGFPPTDLGVVKITIEFKGQNKRLDMHISE
jgi:hypothetical protein